MTAILFPLFLTILVSAPPQQPRDGARPSATGTSRLSGVVVTDGRSPQPVRRAIVTITASALAVSRSTITDDDGRFAFEALPPGRFTVTAARRSYLTSAFGAVYPGDAGTPVSVGDAVHVDDVRITLRKGAVLTGVVTDNAGTPSPSLQVTVFRVTESRYENAGDDVTDDRGVYRVYGLQPGDYIVAAAPRPTGAGDMGVRSEREVDALLTALERRGSGSITAARPGEIGADAVIAARERTYSFAQVYYPGTAIAAEAATITVAPGEERSGLDFSVTPVPTARVTGVVTGPDGQAARDVQISIVPVGPPVTMFAGAGATGPARTGDDGSFNRSSVTPGTYRILARRVPAAPPRPGAFTAGSPVAGRGPTEWAMAEVTVNGEDIEGLSLALQPAMPVTGRIVFEGTSELPPNLSVIRVALTPASARTVSIPPVVARANGTIEITNLLPGSYQVGLILPEQVAERWWLRSATSGGRDLLDAPLELAAGGAHEIVFTLSDRRPSLSGMVHDVNERPTVDAIVVVCSADRAHWRRESRRVRIARPATDGRYEVTDIPPGEYFVSAVQRMLPDAWHQPAFLERLATDAVRVVIGEGEQKTLALRVR